MPSNAQRTTGFIGIALQLTQLIGGPVKVLLGAAEEHRASSELSQKIWGHSVDTVSDKNCANALVRRLEDLLKKDLADGKLKLEDLTPSNYLAQAR